MIYNNIFTISDIEMGKGDLMDDFKDDELLIKFIQEISQYPGKSLLILNGDTFDFLKMSYQGTYTRYITEEISLWKLEEALKAHEKIFVELQKFVQKDNAVFFVIGNHDFDLQWPKLQKKLQEVLGSSERVLFANTYQDEHLHVEHGNSTDTFYYFNEHKPYLQYKGKNFLNLPFGSYAVMDYLIELKKNFPDEEQLYPRPLALKFYPDYRKASLNKLIKFTVKGVIIDPLFKFFNPTFRVPYGKIIKHLFHHGLNIMDDEKFVKKHFQKLIKKFPDKKAFILGHRHVGLHTINNGYHCLMTDTWRNEFEITPSEKNKNTLEKKLKTRTYTEIQYHKGEIAKIGLKTFQ